MILFREGVCLSACWDTAPPGTRAGTPLGPGRHPPPGKRQAPPPGPGRHPPPPSSAYWKIRSTSGRYASYWNAILFSGNVAHDEEIKFTGSMELNKYHLQEHEPLHHLLSILPQKAQKGLSSLPIEYTCIDVSPEYIALGTSVGLVLLYDRLGQSLQRLNCKVSIYKYIGG